MEGGGGWPGRNAWLGICMNLPMDAAKCVEARPDAAGMRREYRFGPAGGAFGACTKPCR